MFYLFPEMQITPYIVSISRTEVKDLESFGCNATLREQVNSSVKAVCLSSGSL
jgi:hypothetical protein